MLLSPPRPPAGGRSSPIARFFTTATPSLWADISTNEPTLVRDAQQLYDQITTRQSPLRSTSLANDKKTASPKVWAVVAVVATRIARDLRRMNGARRRGNGVVGRKRKAPRGSDDESEPSSANDEAQDHDTDEMNDEGDDVAMPDANRWHVVDFLVEANVSLSVFLHHLSSLFDRLLLEPELLEVTTQLKEEFTVATVLFEKYRAMWKKFALHDPTSASRDVEAPERTESLFRMGWLLFVILKRRLAPRQGTGLGQLYYLLLAVLKLVISQVSRRSVEAEVAAALSALGAVKLQTTPSSPSVAAIDDQSLLEMLCASPKVDADEVTKSFGLVMDELMHMAREEGLLVLPSTAEIDDDEAVRRGVFRHQVARQNGSRLVDHYAVTYLTSCGCFDERVYLDEQSRQAMLGPRSALGHGDVETDSHGSTPTPPTGMPSRGDRAPSINPLASPVRPPGTPNRYDRSASSTPGPPPSPFTVQAWQWQGSSPPPSLSFTVPRGLGTPSTMQRFAGGLQSPFVAQTPVTAAVETSNWIRDTLTASQSFLTPQLKSFFKDCTNEPTDKIATTLQDLSHRLMTSRRRGAPTALALDTLYSRENGSPNTESEYSEVDGSLKKTKNLAIALFYRVLEALLVAERERLHTTNFSSLLNNETFVSSLFACSLEVVLKAHSLITLSFPFLLDTLGVNAFDFGKVIESFVKHGPKLPSALKRHMRDLEQMILDSLAWRSDSGLYAVLAGERQQAARESQSASSTPTNGSSTTSSTPRSTVLQLFFRKVLSLAASRIFRLGNMLELDAKYLNQAWTAIKECLSSQHQLLRDRHLDHVVLCSLYGVCKVNHVKPEVTFKRIIDCYKKLQTPQWGIHGSSAHGNNAAAHAAFASASISRNSHDIIREIKLDDHNTRGDIIKFYNRCFIPTMKVFLLQFQAQEKQLAAANAVVGGASASITTASTSDSEIVAEAAATVFEKVIQSYGPPRTPLRRPVRTAMSTPPLFGSPPRTVQLFTTAEVESLPVSVSQTSPKRVLTSNIYMSPLQNARLQNHRTHMTPRSHALYAFGESPSRDLALINRAVNNSRTAPAPPSLMTTDSATDDVTSGSNSGQNTPTTKRRRIL
ncbi:hypothetical protein Poli38472_007961 [Pythium oligandrum]|uniref:Uncharacterized protein n=1 Tax=Pythium oligandrum TaxID=41045 RepID=A0A8K1CKQ6_PYTOL|nr:hypothetical protein Poli38472_007961 [Pythium oligandrum]|eukprot:TMW65319.1 hypothetical protein Poli38472_007961 [Pythium oligandrum]